jgi:hypothetical protein
MQAVAGWFFALFSAESRLARLSLLIGLFAVLMVARAAIITVRDVTIGQLQIGFIHQIRSRLDADASEAASGFYSLDARADIGHIARQLRLDG